MPIRTAFDLSSHHLGIQRRKIIKNGETHHRTLDFTREHHNNVYILLPHEAGSNGISTAQIHSERETTKLDGTVKSKEATHVQKSPNVASSGPCVAMYRRRVPRGCTCDALM
jgi:hypothetical protein